MEYYTTLFTISQTNVQLLLCFNFIQFEIKPCYRWTT